MKEYSASSPNQNYSKRQPHTSLLMRRDPVWSSLCVQQDLGLSWEQPASRWEMCADSGSPSAAPALGVPPEPWAETILRLSPAQSPFPASNKVSCSTGIGDFLRLITCPEELHSANQSVLEKSPQELVH